ncbi:hypothetical protein LEP1GSC096_2479 [Leptospira interrogans serovar Hebdomadis str. R499]|nr:hypothetical protein LEP1GSC045_3261 [Leptospira interrogans serovar Pomona str. Kennewicki LC82-25]EKN98906.1 hypothetical protein LEP1GSC014_2590 [Leptospira interrogans serovar Pomona str. Pomona]EKR34509.1 hypothetical protein LEP1GSC096_2479 [Leptospira interrogans serovar Hebdomadis str. R499]EMJ62725.1 hypothetical protein LEP1GSC197_1867 [Leptospira interrogans serovar Pomona str. CSL4002]EMN77107.1 hypothetical protein LEP1GSC102_1255 [Leptospira interrogans str. UI 09600]
MQFIFLSIQMTIELPENVYLLNIFSFLIILLLNKQGFLK